MADKSRLQNSYVGRYFTLNTNENRARIISGGHFKVLQTKRIKPIGEKKKQY
jgi:hypothetical protein